MMAITASIDPQPKAAFPSGPCRNRMALKAAARALWCDIRDCDDMGQLDALLAANDAMLRQLRLDLPSWWFGDGPDDELFEGLAEMIDNKQAEIANALWRKNPMSGG